jgi:hypothetical protein
MLIWYFTHLIEKREPFHILLKKKAECFAFLQIKLLDLIRKKGGHTPKKITWNEIFILPFWPYTRVILLKSWDFYLFAARGNPLLGRWFSYRNRIFSLKSRISCLKKGQCLCGRTINLDTPPAANKISAMQLI